MEGSSNQSLSPASPVSFSRDLSALTLLHTDAQVFLVVGGFSPPSVFSSEYFQEVPEDIQIPPQKDSPFPRKFLPTILPVFTMFLSSDGVQISPCHATHTCENSPNRNI